MPSLFIANTSSKHNEFTFRIPGNEQIRRVTIPAGKQSEVIRNAQMEEVQGIIAQHAIYGLIESSQVHRMDKFAGILYSIDKPVSIDKMELAIEKNNEILEEEGFELRKLAALATDAALTETLSHHRGLGTQKTVELEVSEIPEERSSKKKLLNQKIKVVRD